MPSSFSIIPPSSLLPVCDLCGCEPREEGEDLCRVCSFDLDMEAAEEWPD